MPHFCQISGKDQISYSGGWAIDDQHSRRPFLPEGRQSPSRPGCSACCLPSTVRDCNRPQSIALDRYRVPPGRRRSQGTALDRNRLPSTAIDCNRLPSTAIDCPRPQSTALDRNRLPTTAHDCNRQNYGSAVIFLYVSSQRCACTWPKRHGIMYAVKKKVPHWLQ